MCPGTRSDLTLPTYISRNLKKNLQRSKPMQVSPILLNNNSVQPCPTLSNHILGNRGMGANRKNGHNYPHTLITPKILKWIETMIQLAARSPQSLVTLWDEGFKGKIIHLIYVVLLNTTLYFVSFLHLFPS